MSLISPLNSNDRSIPLSFLFFLLCLGKARGGVGGGGGKGGSERGEERGRDIHAFAGSLRDTPARQINLPHTHR